MMKSLAPALLLLMAAPATAQVPSTEHVTVTGTRSRAVLQDFVQSLASPGRITGKLARWEDGVCPVTVGLKPQYADFISRRIKDVAAQVGAPVNARPSCKPNIEIVFTTKPQALADRMRREDQLYLGYHDNSSQADALATVRHPIQAWYTTATRDLRGDSVIDSPQMQGTGVSSNIAGDSSLLLSSSAAVTGSRLGDGKTSALYHVVIVAEPAKLLDYEIGTLGDYIALLALAQLSDPDACRNLPSMTNLLVSGCSGTSLSLTANDLGFLRGLYHMSPGRTLRSQEDEVVYQMQQGGK
jgi:hypothetical protein